MVLHRQHFQTQQTGIKAITPSHLHVATGTGLALIARVPRMDVHVHLSMLR